MEDFSLVKTKSTDYLERSGVSLSRLEYPGIFWSVSVSRPSMSFIIPFSISRLMT